MSRIADDIVREYKIKKAYSKRKRQLCKEQECKNCSYFNICVDREEKE